MDRCNIEFIELWEIEGIKLFLFKTLDSYGCFFDGRDNVPLMDSEEGAKIEGLCAFQKITGKTLPKPL